MCNELITFICPSCIGEHRSRILPCTEALVKLPCKCSNDCFDKLTFDQIKKSCERFNVDYPIFAQERKYILGWFESNQESPRKFTYSISGINVCWKTWITILGITERRFYMEKKDFLQGRRNPAHGLTGSVKESLQSEACRNYLETYFSESCDYMPNSKIWHLTSSSRKSDVYREMEVSSIINYELRYPIGISLAPKYVLCT